MDQSFTKDLSLQNLSPSSKLTRDEEYMNSVLDHEAQTEKLYHTERAANEQILWNNFQHTAAAIAQLYKDKDNGRDEQWFSFQNAAEHATVLYRQSLEGYKSFGDVSHQYGYSRRNKELISWLRKKRKFVKRDELIKFLCRKAPSPYLTYLPTRSQPELDNRLQTFKEAVYLGGLNTRMSGINFDGSQQDRSSPRTKNQQVDLSSFLHAQCQYHDRSSPSRKRSASMSGANESSPKRRR